MIRSYLSAFKPGFPAAIAYMLQMSEYKPSAYIAWLKRSTDYSRVMHRRQLHRTTIAKAILLFARCVLLLQVVAIIVLLIAGVASSNYAFVGSAVTLLLLYPIVVPWLIVVPVLLGDVILLRPRRAKAYTEAKAIFSSHSAKKIAIMGSYGKTTVKELLLAVLSEHFKVQASPANKNVISSHVRLAQTLTGNEDILLIEFGEEKPGDIAQFCELVSPTHAVITGIAPAHMEGYGTLEDVVADMASIKESVESDWLYGNQESVMVERLDLQPSNLYDRAGGLGLQMSRANVRIDGMTFRVNVDNNTCDISTQLIGRHLLGPLTFVIGLALQFGMPIEEIKRAVATTKPFAHRMETRQLSGATIIDDTYNGNIEGIKAGTELLHELSAKRKIYVTPGLVEQGDEVKSIHEHMGVLIAKAQPDIVVLMRNSVAGFIETGLKNAGYQGELRVEADPLHFYANLEHFIAAGDVVLMQNDWTDNYA